MSGRQQILDDKDFWLRLEYEASTWLGRANDPSLRRFWVDGFIPECATNSHYGLDVEGAVWIGEGGRDQYQYRFVASLPQKLLCGVGRRSHIKSLSLDVSQRFLGMVLASGERIAEPDAPPNCGPAEPLGNSGVTKGPPSVS